MGLHRPSTAGCSCPTARRTPTSAAGGLPGHVRLLPVLRLAVGRSLPGSGGSAPTPTSGCTAGRASRWYGRGLRPVVRLPRRSRLGRSWLGPPRLERTRGAPGDSGRVVRPAPHVVAPRPGVVVARPGGFARPGVDRGRSGPRRASRRVRGAAPRRLRWRSGRWRARGRHQPTLRRASGTLGRGRSGGQLSSSRCERCVVDPRAVQTPEENHAQEGRPFSASPFSCSWSRCPPPPRRR